MILVNDIVGIYTDDSIKSDSIYLDNKNTSLTAKYYRFSYSVHHFSDGSYHQVTFYHGHLYSITIVTNEYSYKITDKNVMNNVLSNKVGYNE